MERQVLNAMKGAMGFPKLRLVFDWQFDLELKGPKGYIYIYCGIIKGLIN
jgi:hypothetical protein